jgi:RNA polymerase sigma-70 factor (ECF subfamily)
MPEAARGSFAAWAELDGALDAMLAAARARYPGVAVEADEFFRHVAARVPEQAEPARFFAQLHAADLYLACACARGDETAARIVSLELGPPVRAALTQVARGDAVAEIVQQVMAKVLAGEGEPAIVKYAGRGKLSAWLQVMAIRAAHDAHRRRKAEPVDDVDGLVERAVVIDGDPELERIKASYRAAFKRAFAAAFAELDRRERAVLRYHYVDGLGIDELAALYQVHRATIARWRQSAREALFTRTRALVRDELRLAGDELDSLMRLIDSQVSVSFERLAADDGPEPGAREGA